MKKNLKLREKKVNNLLNMYFKAFASKDLIKLDKMFSENILLKDWTTNLKTKKKVLGFNKKIFNSFLKINIKIINKFYSKNFKSVACQLIVSLDKKKIHVTDIIYFNNMYKISKIFAFTNEK